MIDDFDLDVRIDLPEGHRVRSPIVRDHGGWTTQSIFVSSIQTLPHGFLDVNGVIPNMAVFDISHMQHSSIAGEFLSGPSVQFAYFNTDGGVDLTADGTANAIILDIAALTTSYFREDLGYKPGGFILDVRSELNGVEYRSGVGRLRYDGGPHSIVVPFDSFRPSRGFGPIDFGHIESLKIYYELTAFDRGLTEDASVYLALDSIRTGLVPEPSSGLEIFKLFVLIIILKRRR